jgi:hypothetical protein
MGNGIVWDGGAGRSGREGKLTCMWECKSWLITVNWDTPSAKEARSYPRCKYKCKCAKHRDRHSVATRAPGGQRRRAEAVSIRDHHSPNGRFVSTCSCLCDITMGFPVLVAVYSEFPINRLHEPCL